MIHAMTTSHYSDGVDRVAYGDSPMFPSFIQSALKMQMIAFRYFL